MIRRSFRRGLTLGLLGGAVLTALKTFQSRRPLPSTPTTWAPIPDTTPVVLPVPEPEPVVVEEKKKAETAGQNLHKATLVRVDVAKQTVTFKGKGGKEMTLPLAKSAKIFGEKNEGETLEKFAKDLAKDKDKTIWILEDKEEKHIVELKEMKKK